MKYHWKTRIGNWSEEWELQETKYKSLKLFYLLEIKIIYQEEIKDYYKQLYLKMTKSLVINKHPLHIAKQVIYVSEIEQCYIHVPLIVF